MDYVNNRVVIFDGVCNLCNGFIQFLIKRDPKARLSFVALQSDRGAALYAELKEPDQNFDSIGYLRQGRLSFKSTAVLNILVDLGGLWHMVVVFFIVPKFIRDYTYDAVARNRYRWFGRRDECMVPTPDLKSRFLD